MKPAPFTTYVPQTECQNCGFSPLHYKYVDYAKHVEVSYVCAICGHKECVQHAKRH